MVMRRNYESRGIIHGFFIYRSCGSCHFAPLRAVVREVRADTLVYVFTEVSAFNCQAGLSADNFLWFPPAPERKPRSNCVRKIVYELFRSACLLPV